MKPKIFQYLCIIIVCLLNTLLTFAQSQQDLQVNIISTAPNNRFCQGIPELFQLEARAMGGTEPYRYEWTFTWNSDTLRTQTISIRPDSSGEVTLRVTDSSRPTRSRDVKYSIFEIVMNADFTFNPDSACAQTPVNFTPVVSGGTPQYSYTWRFDDGNTSTLRNPANEFVASGCAGMSLFDVRMEVRDADGCMASVEKPVSVRHKPYLTFADSANPFSPFRNCPEIVIDTSFVITLANRSRDVSCITSYRVAWGDGTVQNNVTFPISHTYTRLGAFQLIVTAENTSGCAVTWTQYVYNQSSPAAGIESYGGTEGCAPIEFAFRLVGYENNSVGTTYTWNFGDGSPQVEWNHNEPYTNDTIRHLYEITSCLNGAGYFTTSVRVANGCDTKTATVDRIRIWERPQALIGDGDANIDTICTNELTQLENISINGLYGSNCTTLSQITWDFGNGITSNAERPPPMSWPVPGEYDVVLTMSNPCGSTSDTFSIVVIDPPVADASVDDTAGCAPFTPKFVNNSKDIREYVWVIAPDSGYTFLNGTNANSWEPQISFNQRGSYQVILYVSNACNRDSVIFNFDVHTIPDGRIENLDNVCMTNPLIHPSVVYNDNGSPVSSFSWTFTGGTPPAASVADPGDHIYTTPGEYTVNLVLRNECGDRSLTDTFLVHAAPEVTVNTPVAICESDSLIISGATITHVTSFEWQTLGDGNFNDNSLLNPVYYPGTNDLLNLGTNLRIVATGESPCNSDTAVLSLTIQKRPVVKVDENVTICEGTEYRIMNATAENYDVLLWSTSGDGRFSDPAILLPVYYPGINDLSTGQVVLTLTAHAINPCLLNATGTFVITYARIPTINAGPDGDICENGQVSLNASGTGFDSVIWRIETGQGSFSDPTSLTPVFTISPGYSGNLVVLTIEATGTYGCPNASDTLELSVISLPVVSAGDDAMVCESGSFAIPNASVQEYANYYWIVNGDGTLNDSSLLNPVYTPGLSDIDSGRVTLTIIAEGNSVCPDVSDDISLIIQKLPVSDAGDDQNVCKSFNYVTTGSQANGASFLWTSTGTGTFENPTALITTYYPSENDLTTGSADLVLRVDAITPCESPAYDTVSLTFIDLPIVSAGNDTTICSESFVPINAYSFNSTQFVWSSGGTGTWFNENTLTPLYNPSLADITNGSVVLTLTSTNPTCPEVSDDMVLTLTPFPVADAGSDDVICEDTGKPLADAYSANYSSLEWSTSGDGNFNFENILNPIYYPGINDIENGSVILYLIAAGIPPCNTPQSDSLTLSIQKNPVVYAGADTIIGEREVFTTINATAENFDQVSWITLGDGTFVNDTNIIATYTHGENDLINKGVYLVIRGTSVTPCVNADTDTIFVLITPIPIVDAGADERICEGSDITISTASAEDYSEIWWTTTGSGELENDSTLTPTYLPSNEDIANRMVMLTLHARGKSPIEYHLVSDTMQIHIIHNVFTDAILIDTACENSSYQIRDIIYRDENTIFWSSSGDGNFSGTGEEYPVYSFSANDRERDTIYLYLQATSLSPCLNAENDTLMIRLYHEPVSSFEYDNPEGCAPLAISFTNISSGEDLVYHWDFGNGMESFDRDPGEIVFQQARIADARYTVTLNVTNRCGSHSTSGDVLVRPIPITDFGMDVAWGCSPKEINFFNVTIGSADTYLWKWGDGKENSTEVNPGSHIFEAGDSDTTYTITLIAENECGVDSMQKSVTIFPNSVQAFFETDTTIGCAPFEVSFINYSRGVLGDEPFLNWSWNFGDGNISDELHPVHVFEKPGKYTVTLFINDTCSNGSFTTEIDVLGAPEVDFITDKTEYCQFDTVFVTPVNMPLDRIAGVIWDFGDSNQGNNFNDSHVYDSAGLFTINLTARDIINGCAASTSKEITIHQAPVTAFNIPENNGCQPLQITFLNQTTGGNYFAWDYGNGNISVDVNGQQLFTEPGTYNITLRATDFRGCTTSASNSLHVNPRPVSAFEPSSLLTCFPPVNIEFINLSEGANDFSWDFGNGVFSKNTNPVITYSEYGDYIINLIATNMYLCSDTSEMIYHVYHNPVADFTVDTTIGCDPFMVPFINLSDHGVQYYWHFGEQSYSEDEEPVFTFEGPGTRTVSLRVVGLGGCSDSITREDLITTNPSPISDFTYTRTREIDTIQFHNFSSGAISYLWDFGDGQSSEEENPWHSYNNYGTYDVSLTTLNEFDCINTKVDLINFEIFKGLFMPTAFSPGSLSQDVREFKPVGTGLSKFHLVIFDTWGNLLWETTKLENGVPVEGWDGTLNGKPLPPDVYVWHLREAIFKDGKAYEGKRYGSITLIK